MKNASNSSTVFSALQPANVWRHFAMLCQHPRPSKGEAPLREDLQQWASRRKLESEVDPAGNLLIRKPAASGLEHAPCTILQAHLDMVGQKNAGTVHDFAKDPITPVLREDWLIAENTTLGADNGIGVALILAVLEDATLRHGPIEALLTVDEEAGMGGAHGLPARKLRGQWMLNLDTEEWGELYLGCAGGMDVDVVRTGTPQAVPPGFSAWQIDLSGLRGGHSGIDIHTGRGNAIKLLVRVLADLEKKLPCRLARLEGGTARNALPREASASLVVPETQAALLLQHVSAWQVCLRQELKGVDKQLTLACHPTALEQLLSPQEQTLWLSSLHAAPHGVRRMSPHFSGVVETSNNLGMVHLTPAQGSCNFMVRSLLESAGEALADEIVSLFALSGTPAGKSGAYPGWNPDPDSPLLALCQSVYRREYGQAAREQVIHAGLECGIIKAKYPELEIVSFGPTIRGAHAPGEAVHVESVGHVWHFLTALLAEIGTAKPLL